MIAERAVWAVVEARSRRAAEVAAPVMTEAARVADQLGTAAGAVVLGECDESLIGTLACRGASRVFLAEVPGASPLDADPFVPILADLVRRHQPAAVLWETTALAQELAPRVAARLGTGLASGCLDVTVAADGVLRLTRAVYGGRASCTVVCPRARPQMATLQQRPATPPSAAAGRQPEVARLEIPPDAPVSRTAVAGFFQEDPWSMDLAEADVIVAGGRGVGGREGFRPLVELASLLGGAVAASRPVVDAGWVPSHRQVGQSGRTVAPSLYIACGISGAPHHLVGMRDSKTVVAINSDRNAPVFGLADLGIVGDLHDVLPPVVARLRETGAGVVSPYEGVLDAFARS